MRPSRFTTRQRRYHPDPVTGYDTTNPLIVQSDASVPAVVDGTR